MEELIKIIKIKIEKNGLYLEVTEVVNSEYQDNSRVLCAFILNKSFGQLLDISPKSFISLKILHSEFSFIEARFTNNNSKPVETEGHVNITLVID